MNYFLQQLVNGVSLGAVYGLIALGYTMVYGIIGMINFAHGDIYMVGAFISLIFLTLLSALGITSLPLALALVLLVTVAITALYGWTVERVAYRPLRDAPRLAPLISAIGVSIVLQNYVQLAQGARVKVLPPLDHGLGDTVVVGRVQRHDQRASDRHRRRDDRADGRLHVAHPSDAAGTRDARDRAGHDHGGARRRRCRPHDLGHVRDRRGACRGRGLVGDALLRRDRFLSRASSPASKRSRRRCWAASVRFPARCWAGSSSASPKLCGRAISAAPTRTSRCSRFSSSC